MVVVIILILKQWISTHVMVVVVVVVINSLLINFVPLIIRLCDGRKKAIVMIVSGNSSKRGF